MQVKVSNRLTNHETLVEGVTVLEVSRREIYQPSSAYDRRIPIITTVVTLYRGDEIVGSYPVDDYYVAAWNA